MLRTLALVVPLVTGILFADAAPPQDQSGTTAKIGQSHPKFNRFTGKIIGNNVRMRSGANLDSAVITELSKGEYVVVTGEQDDFFVVEAPDDLKAYVFRGFVIDDCIEGDRVNIRLFPDREAPIIGHYSAGQPVVGGTICKQNKKWLELPAPKGTQFYIAKEFIEYAGKVELKAIHDKRKINVAQLFESTELLVQSELCKPFHEIDITRITQGFQTIINDYTDFPTFVAKATHALAEVQENYLHRKISFLETKASKMCRGQIEDIYKDSAYAADDATSPSDRMKVWEPIEQALFLSWASMHHAKTMEDFYHDQKMKCRTISGILEAYRDPVKNKPGDFVLKDHDVTLAYIYSTHVDLDKYVGKRVNLMVTSRPNNNFAFPAYYALSVE